MDVKFFEELYQKMTEEEIKIGKEKGKEYTQGNDRLDNFKRIAKESNLDPKMVLWVYLKKHLDSICSFIKYNQTFSEEPIEGRIKDARVYLALLRGLIEDERKEKAEPANVEEKKLIAIKKDQHALLFGLIGYLTKEDGLCPNPFYGKEEKDIWNNKELAISVYPKIFKSHRGFVYGTFGDFRGLIPDERMEELII